MTLPKKQNIGFVYNFGTAKQNFFKSNLLNTLVYRDDNNVTKTTYIEEL